MKHDQSDFQNHSKGRFSLPIPFGALRGWWWCPSAGGKVLRVLQGKYEPAQTSRFLELVRPDDVVFDIGAATGYYTLLAGKLTGHKGRVVAFEPMLRNRYFLETHVAKNGLSNVSIYDFAIGGHNGAIGFTSGTGTGTGRITEDGSFTVNVKTLDTFVQESGTSPTHLKIDVEGAELSVLQGAVETLRTVRPTLFLSTHGAAVHRDCCEFLRSLGYQLTPMHGNSVPLESCDEVLCQPHRATSVRAA